MGLDGKGQQAYWDGIRGARARYKALRRQRLSVLGPARPKATTGSTDSSRPTDRVSENAPKTSATVSGNANQAGSPGMSADSPAVVV